MAIRLRRMPEQFISDDRRVITRPFMPGSDERVRAVVQRVMSLSEQEAAAQLTRVLRDFDDRHKRLVSTFEEHFEEIAHYIEDPSGISVQRRRLIGSYFTMEYSVEAAALFNPSMVPHPDQSGLKDDELRFIMSLRATGEGHVSSVAFRTGVIEPDGDIRFDPVSRFVEAAKRAKDHIYHKETFLLKLIEMAAYTDIVGEVLDLLPDEFAYRDLLAALETGRKPEMDADLFNQTADNMRWLARSNYQLKFPHHCDTSEVIIFPVTENESRGIEDARFVRFVDGDGSATYYGTYTAYNGFRILPQLLETKNFTDFRINTLNGRFVQNKGVALFPRKIGRWYMMISRVDGENLFIMPSSNVRFWNDAQLLQAPRFPWEFVQIGNCGSPIETDEGWLLLTHGVGPMRQYCIGASLLDLESPARVIAQLKEPLIAPNAEEREGYVPNVVYSCGGLVHNGLLVLPYATSDSATTFATVPVQDLLDHMLRL